MPVRSSARAALAMLVLSVCAGCQVATEVLERRPGHRLYDAPKPAADKATSQVLYALFSENAYYDVAPGVEHNLEECRQFDDLQPGIDKLIARQEARTTGRLPNLGPEWKIWGKFPRLKVWCKARNNGLHLEVWERTEPRKTIVVAFRGTEFTDLHDWRANLRWFARFIPGYRDSYSIVGEEVADSLEDTLRARGPAALAGLEIIATGHSLGGGLAQHFAYAFPSPGNPHRMPRIRQVFAFDPSPVTGWSSLDAAHRAANAEHLYTERVFEHGEVLAYLRLLISYLLPPSASSPAIAEVRYNFTTFGPIGDHSMRCLAEGMLAATEALNSPRACPLEPAK